MDDEQALKKMKLENDGLKSKLIQAVAEAAKGDGIEEAQKKARCPGGHILKLKQRSPYGLGQGSVNCDICQRGSIN